MSGKLDAVFINLDRASERRDFMEGQAAALGLDLQRLSAVEATGLSPAQVAERGMAWERPLTQSELACFLSHETLWKRVAAGSKPLIILEDDVALSRRFMELLPRVAGFEGADFVNLESYDRRRFLAPVSIPVAQDAALVRVHRDKSGSGAYVLWPGGAKKLLARAGRGAAPVDAFVHGLRGLRSFQIEPAVAMQLHIVAAHGHATPISAASSIQVPRDRLKLAWRTLPFHRRRAATQLRLAGDQIMRLFGRPYRRTRVAMDDILKGPAYRSVAAIDPFDAENPPDQSAS